MSRKTVLHWFRKGMRLHDNPALLDAIKRAETTSSHLRAIYILDPQLFTWLRVGPNRWRFLFEALDDLNESLKRINSRLWIIRGVPEKVFPDIIDKWNVSTLTYEYDTEPYAKRRDKTVEDVVKRLGVDVVCHVSHTIFNPEVIVARNNGPPLTYQKFLSVIASMKVDQAVKTPERIPDSMNPPVDSANDAYQVPTLDELFEQNGSLRDGLGPRLYPGGETEALKRLDTYTARKSWICKFEKPKTAPNSLEPSTTVLSPYLKFGCLSARLFYWRIVDVYKGQTHSKPPTSLLGQLYWREFYYTVSTAVENFDRMEGNRICLQVAWQENREFLEAWTYGKTGYPFIDAIMRQLRLEGWIHHLARHAVACFLTRGDLWISWEAGLKVFEELLLDADWALNAGNWMWLSASAFFHQYFRVYSPVVFGQKTDKTGAYIRKYVPELKNYPAEFIYEPWKAPAAAQKKYGCVVGVDYPRRIVVHEEVMKRNLQRMGAAYKASKEGKNDGGKRSQASASAATTAKRQKTLNEMFKKK